jgi:hypothetical protein
MGILDDLLGNEQLQKQYKDFVKRYEQGDPSEGYSDQEVLKRYGEVSHAVPADQYAQAAQESLSKLSPEDREEFLKMLKERAAERGVKLPGKVASDPKDWERSSPIFTKSRGSCGISSALATPKRKRQDPIPSQTCFRPRWPRPCSRASRPSSSSA